MPHPWKADGLCELLYMYAGANQTFIFDAQPANLQLSNNRTQTWRK